jgi:threonine dehydrogenase-like Zn-dependent dehydrogenase
MSDFRVATFAGPGARPVIQMVDRPRLGRRGALIAVGACGVSDADLRHLLGTPGEEAAGMLEEMGSELKTDSLGKPLKPGVKVLVPSFVPCLRCVVCLHHPSHASGCLNAVHLRGGWADRVHVDFAEHPGARLYRLPDDMPLWLASLTAPFATAMRALQRAQSAGGFPPGATVVVHGTGATGLLAVAAAQEMGAGRIVVAGGPEDTFLRLCRQFGAEATIAAAAPEETIEIVRETVGGLGADLVLSHGYAATDALSMLRIGGICVHLGPGSGAIASDFADRDLTLIGSRGHTLSDLPAAIRVLHRARGRYPFLKMLTRYPLTAVGVAAAVSEQALRPTLLPNPEIAGP